MTNNKSAIALVGAGSMGAALLRGWIDHDVIDMAASAVFDPAADDVLDGLARSHGFALNPEPAGVKADVLVFAIKPQMAATVLPDFEVMARDAVVLSVMAGKSIAAVSRLCGGARRVARAMPNLPAAIGKGVSGLFAPDSIDSAGRVMLEKLMAAAGETVWVDREEDIDLVTAVSGSGPAYFFHLVEALAEAGEAAGLDAVAAEKLARATLVGAGALLDIDPRSATEMRRAVTSPGGTTEAALKVLDNNQALRRLMKECVEAAARRAGELTD